MRTSHDVSDTHVCGQVSPSPPEPSLPATGAAPGHDPAPGRGWHGAQRPQRPARQTQRPQSSTGARARAGGGGRGGGSLATLARPSARPSHTVCWLRLRLSHALTVIFKRNNGIQHDTTHERHVACVGRVTPDTHPERYAPRTNWQLPRTPGTRGQTARMAMTI